MDVVDDVVQDTLLKAMTVWKYKGIPQNPSAWLYTVAKRKAIDVFRQQKIRKDIHAELGKSMFSEWALYPKVHQLFLDHEIEDSQLRMIFACCHPAIPYESQVALTLKTLCGLSTTEIARSFLTNDETITKRLYRAREKITQESIDLEVPIGQALVPRMDVVLHTLYLLFNEGYNSCHEDRLIREDLCAEALRLALLLTRHSVTNTSQANALVALICLQVSREEARVNEDGSIILLQDQDRNRWNKELIEKGLVYLDVATSESIVTEYHLEAAIAALHATAKTFAETNWHEIHKLYQALSVIKPGPIVALNKAIAFGYAESAHEGLAALQRIDGLDKLYLYHATLGDFYHNVGDNEKSVTAYKRALTLTNSKVEKALLEKKINYSSSS